MVNHIMILAAVMLITGLFGGLINFYLFNQHDSDTTTLPRCIVVAVGSAFLVPVILDLVSSELILESQGDPSRLLIYTGFCLIAAIASRVVLTNMPERILQEAQRAKQNSESIQYDLKVIQEELMPLIETETEQDLVGDDNSGPLPVEDELDVTSAKVLKVLGCGRFIFRSIAGLCREANADESTMLKTLNVLVARNLAGKVSGKKGMRWYVTDKGRRAMEMAI